MSEKIKNRIVELVDKSWEPWRKAAFYTNPVVLEIMDRLYREWEERGRRGIPLDYATKEELERLYELAIRVTEMKESDFLPQYFEEEDAYGVREHRKKSSKKKSD